MGGTPIMEGWIANGAVCQGCGEWLGCDMGTPQHCSQECADECNAEWLPDSEFSARSAAEARKEQ